MDVDIGAPTTASSLALANTAINWARLGKTRFHVIGALLFTAQQALLHPTALLKTRVQVVDYGLSHMSGTAIFKHVLRNEGVRGLFKGLGTGAIDALPGRVLALTSLEVSKDLMLRYVQDADVPQATRIGIANGVA